MANMSTWETVELPILGVLLEEELGAREIENSSDIEAATSLTKRQVARGLGGLNEAGFVRVIDASGGGGGDAFYLEPRLAERGRRAVGQWPSNDPVGDLLAVLDSTADQEQDPAESSKLRSVASSVRELGVGTAGSVLATFLARQMGIS